MIFSDVALARRLECAEGFSCAQYAVTRSRLFPESNAAWMECGGAYAVFDGVDSPCTQTFGMGLFEELKEETLDIIEQFFLDRDAPVMHEVSPFAGVAALNLLCRRGYRPMELSSVLFRAVEQPSARSSTSARVRIISADEASLWSEISARGWAHNHPELREFLTELGQLTAARAQTACFLAESDGQPGAAGVLTIHDGVALFAGSSTVPELRRRGLQTALLEERMRYAFDHACNLAMMVALPGSESQRNAERRGFQIAYTRTKWQLFR
jgi:GNAT superfamily N-acetyltransferase